MTLSINPQIPANRTKSGFSDNPKTKIYTRQGDRDDGFVRMTKPKTRHVGQIPVFVNKREIVNDLRFVNTLEIVNTLSFSILWDSQYLEWLNNFEILNNLELLNT